MQQKRSNERKNLKSSNDYYKKREKRKTLLILSLLCALLYSILSCSSKQEKPNSFGEIWLPDSKTASLFRHYDSAEIKCDSEKFDKLVCMSAEDFAYSCGGLK